MQTILRNIMIKGAMGTIALIAGLSGSSSVWAGACPSETSTLSAHASANPKRAEFKYNILYYAMGSGDYLGTGASTSMTLYKGNNGDWNKVDPADCGGSGENPPPPSGNETGDAQWDNPETGSRVDILNITGKYGVAMAGSHYLQGSSSVTAYPRATAVDKSVTVSIPSGATVRHAFLYYMGTMAMKNSSGYGDFTADVGGTLDDADDVRANKTYIKVGSGTKTHVGPDAQPAGASSVGSDSKVHEPLNFHFGTLTNTLTTYWSNRVDVTGLFSGVSGNVTVAVDAPDVFDPNANSSSSNGGNPAGSTLYNDCSGNGGWAVVVIYEDSSLPTKQILMKDRANLAWDYMFFHKGFDSKPTIVFDHDAIVDTSGLKFHGLGTGSPAGAATSSAGVCTCGCGGLYVLGTSGYTAATYWTNTLVDPETTWNDPLHRDSTNAPSGGWKLVSDLSTSISGNDWTTVTSGAKTTLLPNLWEGKAVSADSTVAKTTTDINPSTGMSDTDRDTYAGHKWGGLASVSYGTTGDTPNTSVLSVAMDPSRVELGATRTSIMIAGDQKDVFKPQQRVYNSFMILEVPVSGGSSNTAPVITLNGNQDITITEGDSYSDAGASASDAEDGSLSVTTTGSVDNNTVGVYVITYSATDSGGLTTEKSRSVTVIAASNTQPVITINGSSSITLEVDDTFVDDRATVVDAEDGNSTISGSCNVDTSTAGTYSCTYNYTDNNGWAATQKTRTVTVTNPAPPPASCWTATVSVHQAAGRAADNAYKCRTVGGLDDLSAYYNCSMLIQFGGNPTVSIQETSSGVFDKVTSCP